MKIKEQNVVINSVREKTEKVYRKNIIEVTDFLEPSEIDLYEDYLRKSKAKVKYSIHGGYAEAERKKICIAPLDEEIFLEDFNIKVIEALSRKMSKEINHRDILGALMSTGIKREKTGDIFVIQNGAVVIASEEMVSYLSINFPIIKGNNFGIEIYAAENYKFPEVEYTEKVVNISSWRLDGFLSKAYNLSRSEAQGFINSGKVKVNHRENQKADYILEEDMIISVRGKGRFIIKEDLGTSKKGNFRVLINIY